MNTEAKRAWIVNGMMAVLLGAAIFLKVGAQPASAAGSGLQTDGMMLATGSGERKLLVVNTTEKRILLYNLQGLGEFRLLSARSYEFDQQFPTDTSKSKKIEQDGISATEAAIMYGESKAKKK
ncbi:MAG TPA: hypothetical protein VEJ63_23400 [Planctomycetota bacterium]|nr:hypothetical protein [Planctomycetota bacterium]